MRLILIIVCCLVFLTHSEVLRYAYPALETDYEVFLKYYYMKDVVNELLFALLFLFAVLSTKSIIKGMCMFGFVLTFASFVDKAFLGVFDYLYTDVLLLIFATCISFVVARKTRKNAD